ncbi:MULTISPECIES: Clp protease N-terminal domain-containing protein [unclassified Streptomyces]|uniref:Clp protease N-terminal domain-containing protein n=1 Tax=unclassified Streptomyces TaxID=2593676 RepID=UPI000363279B|nr:MULTISPECIES: Clp protease N-terminal domain-containing protein [unclassified Streptomyces]MYY06487.1 hypothetical protein [Streptomyces sp. SID4913]
MEATTSPDWAVTGILGAARGARTDTDGPIGSQHLLAGIATARGAARKALAAEGLTKVALLSALRARPDHDTAWSTDDGAAQAVTERDVLGEEGEPHRLYTGAAARALTAAREEAGREGAGKFGAGHLLRGLLREDNRAVEMLGACEVSPQAVLARLDADTATAESAGTARDGLDDGLDPLLHPTRDILLGHSTYRRRTPLWMRLLFKLSGVNWAARPAWWVRMETYEQAHRLGGTAVGTEHVLLAVLATHEVALRYPHLARENAPDTGSRYAGGERLAGLGIDYASVHRALTADDRLHLTADPRPVEQYTDETSTPDRTKEQATADPGTGPLVEALLGEGTRARQLVDALAVPR